jgi:FixJ family two-component response regulator
MTQVKPVNVHERTVKMHRTTIATSLKMRSVAELTRLAKNAFTVRTFPKGQ